jgi:hypothetical protein
VVPRYKLINRGYEGSEGRANARDFSLSHHPQVILLLKLQGKDLFLIHYVNEESVNYIGNNTLSEAISNCVPFWLIDIHLFH